MGKSPVACRRKAVVVRGSTVAAFSLSGGAMDQVIGVIGQAILILVGLALLVVLVFFVLLVVRAILKLARELQPSRAVLPPTDAYIPQGFDQMRNN
jgi:hypothetical protein